MRSSTALAVVLSAAALSISPAMAQTAPDTSDPAAGAEQTMPGTSPGTSGTDGTAAQDQTMPGMPDAGDTQATRSEERRGGKECVVKCRSRGAPDHKKKKKTQ